MVTPAEQRMTEDMELVEQTDEEYAALKAATLARIDALRKQDTSERVR